MVPSNDPEVVNPASKERDDLVCQADGRCYPVELRDPWRRDGVSRRIINSRTAPRARAAVPSRSGDDPRHGGATDADRVGDRLAGQAVLMAQHLDPQRHGGRRGPAHGAGREAQSATAPSPAAARPPVLSLTCCARDLAGRLAERAHAAHSFHSTTRRQTGILVHVHPGGLLKRSSCLAAPDFLVRARMDNLPADNLVRLHN
jgi:hypothetical protein